MKLVRRSSRKRKGVGRKKRSLRFRMKAIPSIATSEFDWESMDMENFLNMKVPYLAVKPINYTLLLEDYPIIEGSGKVYRLNKDFTFTFVENYQSKLITPPLQHLNRRLEINGHEFSPTDLFVHKFADIFNPQKWIQLGVKDTKFFKDLFSDVPDIRISTKPNIIHLFIFLNAMPALVDFMQLPENKLRTSIERFFTQSGWELINFMDIKRITGKINRENLNETLNDSETKKRVSSILCSHDPVLGEDCPTPITDSKELKKLWQGELTALLQSIKNLRTIFQNMQSIPDTENLGYIFLLNYWVFRVMNLSIIQNKLPVNASQQMETLMTAYAMEGTIFDPTILQLDVSNFVPQDSVGIFKGTSYPNCVENSIFKMFQVLIWDFDHKQYNPDLMEINNPKLRVFLEELNESKDKSHIEWNNLVSGVPNVRYNSTKDGKGYNIKSNRVNVLTLLNSLTATTYPTVKEWLINISRNNKFLKNNISTKKSNEDEDEEYDEEYEDENEEYEDENEDVDEDGNEIFITLRLIYSIDIMYNHTSFYINIDKSSIDNFIKQLSVSSLYAINEIGSVDSMNSMIVESIYKRDDFRIRYITNLVNMTMDDNVIMRIKHPDDLVEMKRYRDFMSIIRYSFIPIPTGFIPDDIIDLNFPSFFNQFIDQGVLPASLQTLTFGYEFNQPIGQGVLPAGLQSLTFGSYFNKSIDQGVLPAGLQTLNFGSMFNQPIGQEVLPIGLQTLSFGCSFNQPIGQGILPAGLQALNFGSMFNQPIGQEVLPIGLQTLSFGWRFNQFIDQGVLPASLQTLTFGYEFNQPIGQGVLLTSLQTLSFGEKFNQPIGQGVLPTSLQILTFGYNYNQPINKEVLPSSLKKLTIGIRIVIER